MKSALIKCVFLISLILLFASFINAEDWSKVRKAIEEMNNKMEKAMVSEDVNTISSFYATDIVSLPDYKPALRGIDNVLADYKKDLSDGFKYYSADFKTHDLYGSGDLAVEVGDWMVSFKLPGGKEKMNDQGKYVVVWQKQSNGSWKIKTESWNTDSFPIRESPDQKEVSK